MTRPGRRPGTARVPAPLPQRQSVYVVQAWWSTGGRGAGGRSPRGAAKAADDRVPAPAAAATAAASTVRRDAGLGMGETPGHRRNGAAVHDSAPTIAVRVPVRPALRPVPTSPILVSATGVTCGWAERTSVRPARRLGA